MKLLWLKPEEVDLYWERIKPDFQRVIDKATHGEFLVEDIREQALEGDAVIGVAEHDGEVVMALAFEFRHYRRKMGVNVFAMGGRRLMEFMGKFLPPFKEYCKAAGADWIECSVSPGMEKLHHKSGFKTVYRSLRLEL